MRASAYAWLGLAVGVGPQYAAAQSPSQAAVARAGDLVLVGGRLWDGRGNEARDNPGILVRNGTIMAVGRVEAVDAAEEVLRLGDEDFIMPGLFDLHAHYAVDLFGEGRVDEYRVNPVLFLANGVTSTFPAGEVDPTEAALGRARVASGEVPGPRIYSSGPYWGSARPGWSHDAMTPDSVRKEATYWALQGVRGFKAKGIRADQLEALIKVAHAHGVTVTGHLGSGFRGSVNPRDAILMGIDRVEHFMGGDAFPEGRSAYESIEMFDERDSGTVEQLGRQTQLFVDQGTYFNATMSAYDYWAGKEAQVYDYWHDERSFLTPFARGEIEARLPREPLGQFERIYYQKRLSLKLFYDAGGADQITLGTDHPSWGEWWSGFGVHRELHAMVLAGLPNVVALRAGTINAARAFGVSHRLGTIEPGKYADLVVVRGDPLSRITDTRESTVVIKAGQVYDPAALFESVRGMMGPADAAEVDWWHGGKRLGG
ncbi:MAG: amidohydrolase family protein [Longimicrobiales bacterium]